MAVCWKIFAVIPCHRAIRQQPKHGLLRLGLGINFEIERPSIRPEFNFCLHNSPFQVLRRRGQPYTSPFGFASVSACGGRSFPCRKLHVPTPRKRPLLNSFFGRCEGQSRDRHPPIRSYAEFALDPHAAIFLIDGCSVVAHFNSTPSLESDRTPPRNSR